MKLKEFKKLIDELWDNFDNCDIFLNTDFSIEKVKIMELDWLEILTRAWWKDYINLISN